MKNINWQEAYDLLKNGYEINHWHIGKEINMYKSDLTVHEDFSLREKTLHALLRRNLIKKVDSGCLRAERYILR